MKTSLAPLESLRTTTLGLPSTSNMDPFGPPASITAFVWFIRVVAGINLIASLVHHKPDFASRLGNWIPFEISQGRYLRMFLLSVLLFLLAEGLRRGKRTAWILTIVSLAVAPALHWGRGVIWPQELINLGLIGFLLFHRRHFVANSDRRSVQLAMFVCSVLASTLLIFGTICLHDLRDETSGDDDWAACLQTATELVLAHNTQTQTAQSAVAVDFFSLLRTGGTLVAMLGLFLSLRPVLLRKKLRREHRERVRRLIELYGKDPFDPYALLEDKNYFLTEDGDAAVPYVLSGSLAVALADPIGHPSRRPIAIAEFAHFCRRQDWEPVFYEVSREFLSIYQQAGFAVFKIGEEARLKSEDFHLRGNSFQNLRTARNRGRKLGICFRWYRAEHGVDETLESQLLAISQIWLSRRKAREMSFDMGRWTLEDIRHNSVAIAMNAAGKPLAFALWRSFAQGNGQTLDLMRCLPNERNIMDYVLVESILDFQAQGIKQISLGSAPLANTDGTGVRLIAEDKAVQFLFENLNLIYRYKSLFEFKRKYRPQWQGRYVAYRRGAQLPLVGLALVRVHAREGLWKFLVG